MGYSDFLLGRANAPVPTLNDVINSLHDASVLFVSGYKRNNTSQTNRATAIAVQAFDFIVGEIMRCRDHRKADGNYENSRFETEMNVLTGKMVAPVTRVEHQAVFDAGPNNGYLPTHLRTPVMITAEKLLNKIKHRHPTYANFRIVNDIHIFVICPDKPSGGGPDSVVEFEVENFCDQCRKIAAVM